MNKFLNIQQQTNIIPNDPIDPINTNSSSYQLRRANNGYFNYSENEGNNNLIIERNLNNNNELLNIGMSNNLTFNSSYYNNGWGSGN